jgi:hypothetical protein
VSIDANNQHLIPHSYLTKLHWIMPVYTSQTLPPLCPCLPLHFRQGWGASVLSASHPHFGRPCFPALDCLEGHNIASIHSKRYRSMLDTGDPNAFADYRFGCCCYLEDQLIRTASSVPLSLPFISLAFSLGGPLFFGGAYRESLSLSFPLYVEGTSLSTSLRCQDSTNSASYF